MTSEQFNALNAFDPIASILNREEGKGKVHAEMKILVHTLNRVVEKRLQLKLVSKPTGDPIVIYIGISKLCSACCDCMMKAANEILSEFNIKLETRGTHGRDVEWEPPELFKKGYEDTDGLAKGTLDHLMNVRRTPLQNIFYEIGKLGAQKISVTSKNFKNPSAVSQRPSQTNSDADSISEGISFENESAAFGKNTLTLLFSAKTSEEKLKFLEKPEIAMNLYDKIDGFHICWKKHAKSEYELEELEKDFVKIHTEYRGSVKPLDGSFLL